MSTKNYVLSVLALLLVLTSSASALVITAPTTWTAATTIDAQSGCLVQINAGGSVTANLRTNMSARPINGATDVRFILNGGTFDSPREGSDYCVHLGDNSPVPADANSFVILNAGTMTVAELDQNVTRRAYIAVGAGTLIVKSGWSPYNKMVPGSTYYNTAGDPVTCGTVPAENLGVLYPQPGFNLFVEDLGDGDYKIYGINKGIYGEKPANGDLVVNKNLAEVCFSSTDIVKAKVYFGPGDFNDVTYYAGCMPQLESDITGLNPAGALNVCTSLATKIPLIAGTRYSWAVEGYDALNVMYQRRVFHFDVANGPVVMVQPALQGVFGGGTATFTAEVDSFGTAPTCALWKVGTPHTQVSTGTVLPLTGFRYRLSADKINVQWADQVDYYFKATNSDATVVNTAVAPLKVKVELARWTFSGDPNDTASKTYNTVRYNGTVYGGSGDGVVVEPNYVASGGLDTQAMEFNGGAEGVYVDLPDGFEDFKGGQTIAVWAKIDTDAAPSIRYLDCATAGFNESIQLCRGNSFPNSLRFRGKNTLEFQDVQQIGQWQHFVVTMDENASVSLYINGLPSAISYSGVAALPDNVLRVVNHIGREVDRPDKFKGLIGDLRVYNYAISAMEVASLYATLTGTICYTPPAGDFDNNCVVNVDDLEELAAAWLDCNRYPASACGF